MTADARLIQIVDAAVAEAMQRGDGHIECRAGCSHCCFGPFAITDLDGARLRRGLNSLPPEPSRRVVERAREAAALMGGDLADETQFSNLPCPVLDLETNRCLLHEFRPIACRLHGPAMRVDGVELQHCRLNYTQLDAAKIRTLRVEVDPAGWQETAVEQHLAEGGIIARTYIAFAILKGAATHQGISSAD
jgi:Fe-S-cluster containining protein